MVKKNFWLHIAFYVALMGLLMMVGFTSGCSGKTVPGPTVTVTVTPSAAVPKTSSRPATIREGTWMVGEDVKPGRYRSMNEISPEASCYWEITKSGDIIDNDLPTGGRATVTLVKGQQFKTERCGEWVKTK